MTFRTRTVEKRGRRRSSTLHGDARRNLYLNIGFGFGILAAVVILGGVLFAGYYGDHWAGVLTVNGKAYSMDDIKARASVIDAIEKTMDQRYLDLRNAGKITESDYQRFTDHSGEDTLTGRAVTELTNEGAEQQYADQHGIKVDDAAYNAQLAKEATIAEMRHMKVIAVRPVSGGDTGATPDEVAAAQTRAQKLLEEVKGGKSWDDVAKEGDSGLLTSTAGDLGTATKEGFTGMDPALLDAAFSLQKVNDITPVIQGKDGIFRFATVTSIVPPDKSSNWESQLQSRGANLDAYHSRVRANALNQELKDAYIKDNVNTATKQFHVEEIFFSSQLNQSGGDEAKALVSLFAPGHDSQAGTTLAADDPKWAEAKKRADDFYAQVKLDPSKFRDLARTQSDDKYFAGDGGETPYLDSATWGQALPWDALSTELFKNDRRPGDLIAPVKVTNGYVVAQFIAVRPGPQKRLIAAQVQLNSGADFATVARQLSDSSDATNGGDMGWVAQYQVPQEEYDLIAKAKPNVVFSYAATDSSGSFLFKVIDAQTRLPDANQAAKITANYNSWVNQLVQKATVVKGQRLTDLQTQEQNAQQQ